MSHGLGMDLMNAGLAASRGLVTEAILSVLQAIPVVGTLFMPLKRECWWWLGRWVVESLVVVVAFSHLFLMCALSFFSDHERGVESQS